MSDYDQQQPREEYFSKRVRAGKRTYYFDVKATRSNDYYVTITESKRLPGESEDRPVYEKHKIFLYKEDFEKFSDGLMEALGYIRENQPGIVSRESNPNPSNDQKAQMYNKLLFQFQRLQEQVRLIKAENVEISQQDQQKINLLEKQMRQLYNQTQRLF
jgi:hypothetical protein